MDAVIFIKELKRMCDNYGVYCSGCPIGEKKEGLTCREFRERNPEFFVKLLQEWSEKHKPITNRQKFIEVFGMTFTDAIITPNWSTNEFKEKK